MAPVGRITSALVALVACGDASAPARLEGDPCDASAPCADDHLCLDGICVARATPPAPPRETLAPPAWADIVAPDPPDALDPADGVDVGDETDADVGSTEVTGESQLVLGPHDALSDPSDTRLGLAAGQAAAREVAVPEPAEAIAIDVVAYAPDGAAGACGWYEAAVWPADPEGAFAVAPTWRSAPLIVASTADVVRVALPERVPLPAGPVRFGLVYQGPCEASFAPWIGLDASGLTGDSWVWAGVWIPGATLELGGRWGLSLVVAVQVR